MMGLPVAVFLHNRFSGSPLSFLLFFPRSRHPPPPPLRFGDGSSSLLVLAPGKAPIRKKLLAFFGRLPISPYVVLRPARARVQLAGGCILITFMSSDIPARFIAPAPADSAKTSGTNQPTNQPPSYRVPPFLWARSIPRSSRSAPSSFFSSSGSPLVSWPRTINHPTV